jgi:hypothetical protein
VAPHLIIEKKYLHPTLSGGDEPSLAFTAYLIVFDDKKLKEYVTPRLSYRLEYSVKGRSTVDEKLY